jgi:hypothetical protein
MANFLSLDEQFRDRIEITGYFTIIGAGIFWLVYFAMIFFYSPVQQAALWIKLGLLILAALVMTNGFFIPQHKNTSRILYRGFFLGLSLFSYFHALEQGEWFYLPVLIYSLYVLWVLSHPVSIRFFRKLRPAEEQVLPAAGWLTLHTTLLNLYFWILVFKAGNALTSAADDPLYNPEQGLLQLVLAFFLFALLLFLRLRQNWARWLLAFLCLGIGCSALPDLGGPVRINWDYAKALGRFLYFFFAAGLYLIFSPSLRNAFRKVQPMSQP